MAIYIAREHVAVPIGEIGTIDQTPAHTKSEKRKIAKCIT